MDVICNPNTYQEIKNNYQEPYALIPIEETRYLNLIRTHIIAPNIND